LVQLSLIAEIAPSSAFYQFADVETNILKKVAEMPKIIFLRL
jgi:hypothetical protein